MNNGLVEVTYDLGYGPRTRMVLNNAVNVGTPKYLALFGYSNEDWLSLVGKKDVDGNNGDDVFNTVEAQADLEAVELPDFEEP